MLFMAFFAGLGSSSIGWMLFWCVLGLLASDRSWPTFVIPMSLLLVLGPQIAVWSILLIWALEWFDVVLFSSKDNPKRGRINELLHKHLGLVTDKPYRYKKASSESDVVDVELMNDADDLEPLEETYVNPKKKTKVRGVLRNSGE